MEKSNVQMSIKMITLEIQYLLVLAVNGLPKEQRHLRELGSQSKYDSWVVSVFDGRMQQGGGGGGVCLDLNPIWEIMTTDQKEGGREVWGTALVGRLSELKL